MIKESQPSEKQPERGLPSENYEKLGRQLLKVNPSAARIMFERAGLSEEEIDKFLAEDAARPKGEENESVDRKVESSTVRAMMEQIGFPEEEIEEFFAGQESKK